MENQQKNPMQVIIQQLQALDSFLGRLQLGRAEHNGINQLMINLHESIMRLQAPGRSDFEKQVQQQRKPEKKIPKGTG